MERGDRWISRLFALTLAVAIAGSTSWFTIPAAGRALESARSLLASAGFGATDLAAADESHPSAADTGARPGSAGDSRGKGPDGAPGPDPSEGAAPPVGLPDPGTVGAPDPGSAEGPGPTPIPGVRFGSLLLAPSDGYIWPIVRAKITTYFAPARSGTMILGGQAIHNGIDLALPCWTPIRAAHSGTVLYAGRRAEPFLGLIGSEGPYYEELSSHRLTDSSLPIIVVVDDGNGLHSVYVHLARATVKRGDVLDAGDPIGFEGATGNATGCHLHYALIVTRGPWIPVAPLLVEKWHYPPFMRLRVDPLLYLPADSPDAARPRAGLSPPSEPPRYYDVTSSPYEPVASSRPWR